MNALTRRIECLKPVVAAARMGSGPNDRHESSADRARGNWQSIGGPWKAAAARRLRALVVVTSLGVWACAAVPPSQNARPDPILVELNRQLEQQAADLMHPLGNTPDEIRLSTAALVVPVIDAYEEAGSADAAKLKSTFLRVAQNFDAEGGFTVPLIGLCYPADRSADAEALGKRLLGAAVAEANIEAQGFSPALSEPALTARTLRTCGEVLVNVPAFCDQVRQDRDAALEAQINQAANDELFWTAAADANAQSVASRPIIIEQPAPVAQAPAYSQPVPSLPASAFEPVFRPNPPITVPPAAQLPGE